jgi:hypothetical protein
MFSLNRRDPERNNAMTEQILPHRSALPSFLIATRPRRRRLRWANIGFAAVAFLLVALAVLSILYVGPAPFAGPAAPPLHPRPAISQG